MNGKATVFGWTIGGAAMIIGMYMLAHLTAMQSAFHANIVALVEGIQPRTLSLRNILDEFIEHRRRTVVRRSEFELARANERAHILEGLKKALDSIDKVISTIKI